MRGPPLVVSSGAAALGTGFVTSKAKYPLCEKPKPWTITLRQAAAPDWASAALRSNTVGI